MNPKKALKTFVPYICIALIFLFSGFLFGFQNGFTQGESKGLHDGYLTGFNNGYNLGKLYFITPSYHDDSELTYTNDEYNMQILKSMLENATSANISISYNKNGYSYGFLSIYFEKD